MHSVTPKAFLIAHTVIAPGMLEWLEHIGASQSEYYARLSNLIDLGFGGGAVLVEGAARRCYQAFTPGVNPNVTRVREDEREYHENILKQGHGSVLAHTVASFAIEGVSRVWTAEMNRHWAGLAVAEPDAISEGSGRYIRLTDIGSWNPWEAEARKLIAEIPDTDPAKGAWCSKIQMASGIFSAAMRSDEETQRQFETLFHDVLNSTDPKDFAIKKVLTSRFRRNAPMGLATGGVWTFNMRALRHVITLRSGLPAVEEEMHLVVAEQLGTMAKQTWPLLFQDIEWHGDSRGWVAAYGKV